jgi:hypothetical protein
VNDAITAALHIALNRTAIVDVRATIVPSPPHAKAYPGNHLFVNCVYPGAVLGETPNGALFTARSDTITLLRQLVDVRALCGLQSICITFLTCGEAPLGLHGGPDDLSSSRLYRYSVLSSALPAEACMVDCPFLLSNGYFLQSSDIPEISRVIGQEPKTKSLLKSTLLE